MLKQDAFIAWQDSSNCKFETRRIDSRDAALLEIENLQYRFEHDIGMFKTGIQRWPIACGVTVHICSKPLVDDFLKDILEQRYQDSQRFAAKQMSALARKHEESMADERKEYKHEVSCL